MAEPTGITPAPPQTLDEVSGIREAAPPEAAAHQPYVPDDVRIPEVTWPAVLIGAVLGIHGGTSSLYLVLKVGSARTAAVPRSSVSLATSPACGRGGRVL